jgi:hypothetical protein
MARNGLEAELDALARETAFSGVVRVDSGNELVLATAYDRLWKSDYPGSQPSR